MMRWQLPTLITGIISSLRPNAVLIRVYWLKIFSELIWKVTIEFSILQSIIIQIPSPYSSLNSQFSGLEAKTSNFIQRYKRDRKNIISVQNPIKKMSSSAYIGQAILLLRFWTLILFFRIFPQCVNSQQLKIGLKVFKKKN